MLGQVGQDEIKGCEGGKQDWCQITRDLRQTSSGEIRRHIGEGTMSAHGFAQVLHQRYMHKTEIERDSGINGTIEVRPKPRDSAANFQTKSQESENGSVTTEIPPLFSFTPQFYVHRERQKAFKHRVLDPSSLTVHTYKNVPCFHDCYISWKQV